jgi:hypothetical protein
MSSCSSDLHLSSPWSRPDEQKLIPTDYLANVSTGDSTCRYANELSLAPTISKTSRAVILGSRLFNTLIWVSSH